jgi:predicted Zn-dependent protease
MAAQMKVPDRPLDLFLILNGLQAGAQLRPGDRYKIVTD